MGGACCSSGASLHLPLSPRTSCPLPCNAVRLARSLDSLVQSCAPRGRETIATETRINPLVAFMGFFLFLVFGVRFLLKPIQLGICPDKQAAAGDGGGGPSEVVEAVLVDDVEFGAVIDDPGRAVFVEQKQLAVIGPRRCVEATAAGVQALARENRFARLGVPASQQSRVEENVQPVATDQVTRMNARAAWLRPGDRLVAGLAVLEADVARRARANGIERSIVV